jgi:hypothetical protein
VRLAPALKVAIWVVVFTKSGSWVNSRFGSEALERSGWEQMSSTCPKIFLFYVKSYFQWLDHIWISPKFLEYIPPFNKS